MGIGIGLGVFRTSQIGEADFAFAVARIRVKCFSIIRIP